MITKVNTSNDMNTLVSDTISSYIQDGYRIDAKESVVDHEKDTDCTFKAVLKRDVDGSECKTVITLHENNGNTNTSNFKTSTYYKVDLVDGTVWGEESRTFSSSYRNAPQNKVFNSDIDLHNTKGKTFINVGGKKYEVNDLHDGQIRLDWVNSRNDRTDQDPSKSGFNRLSEVIKLLDDGTERNECKSKIDSASLGGTYNLPLADDLEDSLTKLVNHIFGKQLYKSC